MDAESGRILAELGMTSPRSEVNMATGLVWRRLRVSGVGVLAILLAVAMWMAPVAADDTVGLVNPGTGEWLLLNGGFIERGPVRSSV